MERQAVGSRLKGIRNAAGTAALVVSLAACGSNSATETQKPTVAPSEAAVPTMTIAPSEIPTLKPTPTIEITPASSITPAPEASPFKGLSIVEVKELINATPLQIKTEIEKAYLADPNAEEIWKKSVALEMISESQFGVPSDASRYIQLDRLSAADIGIHKLYDIYIQTQDISFYKAALDFYSYAIKNIPNAKEFFPQKFP